jgi:peptidoglycan/xylan/chitin deacetylase (PgdA/CDA1 family)
VAETILLCIDCEGTRDQILRIVDVLERHEVTANFFFTGETALEQPDLLARIAATHHVGSHTWSHPNLRRLDKEGQRREIVRGRRAVEEVIARRTEGFRAPFHAINADTVDVLNEEGFRFDVSGLYYRYDMRGVVEVRPTWFREWTELYGWLRLPPRFGWDLVRGLFFLADPLVIPVHPHYAGRDMAFAAAFEGFVSFASRRGARFLTVPQHLESTPLPG